MDSKVLSRPKSLLCYLWQTLSSGREFGTTSLEIHQKTCAKLWKERQKLKPARDRRLLPQAPTFSALQPGIENHNSVAAESYARNTLQQCPNCGRTFREDRLEVHLRSCTAEKPHRPVKSSPAEESSLTKNEITQQHPIKGFSGQIQASAILHKEQVYKDEKAKLEACKMCEKLIPANQMYLHMFGHRQKPLNEPEKAIYIDNNYVQCEFCTRFFNPRVAERHIPKCKQVVHKPKPPSKTIVRKDLPPYSSHTPTFRPSQLPQPIFMGQSMKSEDMFNYEALRSSSPRIKSNRKRIVRQVGQSGSMSQRERLFCHMCGGKYLEKAIFCAYCGAKK